MVSASSTPGKSFLLSLVTLLIVLISAVQSCDGRHAVAHSAVWRRSRLGTQHVRQRRATTTPHRYVLAEKSNSSLATSSKATSPTPAPPVELISMRSHKHRIHNWIIGFVVGSLAVVIASGLVLFRMAMNRLHMMTRRRVTIFTPKVIRHAEHLAFLEEEDGLEALEEIGRGGCGAVYRAQLPVEVEWEEPRFIAIKKVQDRNGDAPKNLSGAESRQLDKWLRQVQSEIRTVGHIRHRNLMPLAAHVPRPDCHYLVYEYMKNGSLHDALNVGSGVAGLSWPARIRVALGIAAGLEYLHDSHRPQIVHRDLKPANILLDDDLEPRIADFGLAKLMPDEQTHVTASKVAGTLGYIAPEYHQTLKFTAKCDVYRLGVILAVLATGKHPSDMFFTQANEVVGLVKWLRRVMLTGSHAEAIDPTIAGAQNEEQIVLVLRIAVFCTADDPKDRPSAKDVRCMLSQVKIRELVKTSTPKS